MNQIEKAEIAARAIEAYAHTTFYDGRDIETLADSVIDQSITAEFREGEGLKLLEALDMLDN